LRREHEQVEADRERDQRQDDQDGAVGALHGQPPDGIRLVAWSVFAPALSTSERACWFCVSTWLTPPSPVVEVVSVVSVVSVVVVVSVVSVVVDPVEPDA